MSIDSLLFRLDFDKLLRGYPTKPLSRKEEVRIGSLRETHPDRWKLVTHNIRFAVFVGVKAINKLGGLPPNDPESLWAVLQDSMIKASKRYNEPKRSAFCTFAIKVMMWNAMDEIERQRNIVKVPRRGKYKTISLSSTPDHLDDDFFDFFESKLQEESLVPYFKVGKTPEDILLKKEQERIVKEAVNKVPEGRGNVNERDCILGYFGLEGEDRKTLSEIAQKASVSRERVRQVKKKNLQKLKKNKKLRELGVF